MYEISSCDPRSVAFQAQQEFPQDVYADAPSDSADLEALYDALRRQREGLEYVTEILEYVPPTTTTTTAAATTASRMMCSILLFLLICVDGCCTDSTTGKMCEI